MLACKIGNNPDCLLPTDRLAIKAMLAVLDIFEYRLFIFAVPSDYVNKARLIAQPASNALFRRKLNSMICIYHY